jgi:hypothetical protein
MASQTPTQPLPPDVTSKVPVNFEIEDNTETQGTSTGNTRGKPTHRQDGVKKRPARRQEELQRLKRAQAELQMTRAELKLQIAATHDEQVKAEKERELNQKLEELLSLRDQEMDWESNIPMDSIEGGGGAGEAPGGGAGEPPGGAGNPYVIDENTPEPTGLPERASAREVTPIGKPFGPNYTNGHTVAKRRIRGGGIVYINRYGIPPCCIYRFQSRHYLRSDSEVKKLKDVSNNHTRLIDHPWDPDDESTSDSKVRKGDVSGIVGVVWDFPPRQSWDVALQHINPAVVKDANEGDNIAKRNELKAEKKKNNERLDRYPNIYVIVQFTAEKRYNDNWELGSALRTLFGGGQIDIEFLIYKKAAEMEMRYAATKPQENVSREETTTELAPFEEMLHEAEAAALTGGIKAALVHSISSTLSSRRPSITSGRPSITPAPTTGRTPAATGRTPAPSKVTPAPTDTTADGAAAQPTGRTPRLTATKTGGTSTAVSNPTGPASLPTPRSTPERISEKEAKQFFMEGFCENCGWDAGKLEARDKIKIEGAWAAAREGIMALLV